MKQKLNILFLSSWYPNRVYPTRGNFVQRHAEAVATQANVTAVVVEEDRNLTKTYELLETVEDGVRTISVYFKPSSLPGVGKFQKWRRFFKAYQMGLAHAEQENGFDLVHGNVFWPVGMIARKYVERKNIPLVFTEHLTAYLPGNRHRLAEKHLQSIRKSASKTNLILPVSQDLMKAMQDLKIGDAYEVVPNVVNTKWFKPNSLQLEPELLHVSTAKDHHKNVSGILRVLSELKKDGLSVRLRIVSDGQLEPHVAYAKKLGLENEVRFEGTKTPAEIAMCMQESTAFVLFSNYENLPVVICEALCCGIPVIATNVGGIPEMLNASSGRMVSPRDEDGLKQAILEVLQTSFDSDLIAKEAQAKYGVEAVSSQLIDIYEKTILAAK